MKLKIIFIFFTLVLFENSSFATSFSSKELFEINLIADFKKIEFNTSYKTSYPPSFELSEGELVFPAVALHNDSIHRLDFRYKDRKRGIRPFIAPTLLIATGTVFHFSTNAKVNFQDWVQDNFSYSGSVDDYLQYAPGIAVYALNAFGVKGKNNFGNRTAIVIKSLLLNELIVSNLKVWVNEERPNGGDHSFPSGHTSTAFALAQFMHHEYGDRSIWYSIGAYSCAATVGIMRVAKNAHWISDVVAGAGFGMLSTEIVYLTHLYKWDNEHIKNFDIFPWKTKQQSGVTMVYRF